jgi:two-component system, chemotaxis family, response regulator WspF
LPGALDAVDTPVLASPDAKREIALTAKIDQIGAQQRAKAPEESVRCRAVYRFRHGSARDRCIGGRPGRASDTAGRAAGRFCAGDGHRAASGSGVRARHGRLAERTIDDAGARGAEGDRPEPGRVLLAATNDHLHFSGGNNTGNSGNTRLAYTKEPLATPYRPSIDVFFHSVVARWSGNAVGVPLTGMGRDGAAGLAAMRAKGYHMIAQDEATCAVYRTPNAAVAILPLQNIADAVASAFARRANQALEIAHEGALALALEPCVNRRSTQD